MRLLGREPGTQVYRDLDENPGDETFPGISVLRLDGGLFFATAEALEDRVRGLAEDGNRQGLVLDLEGVDFVDSQGSRSWVNSTTWPNPRESRSVSHGSSQTCSRSSLPTGWPI